MKNKNKFMLVILLLLVVTFSGFALNNQNLRTMPEHEYAKITRDRVTAAMATSGGKKEITLAEASLIGLGWFVLYGNDSNSLDLAKTMNEIVFKSYNGTDKVNVIYMDHTSQAYGEMLNLNRFEKRKPDNPSDEYSKIVQNRIEKAFAPGATEQDFKLAEGSLCALGWLTLFGNDANSKELARQFSTKAFNEWRNVNEVYILHTSTGYTEMLNLGRFKLNTGSIAPTISSDPVEEQYWDAVKNSSRAQDFQSYLTTYPNGKYAAIARNKISPQGGNNSQLTNLALGKTASQSSDMGSPFQANEGLASIAVDGNTGGNSTGQITHTACGGQYASGECKGSDNPWWQVDLGANYNVNKIQIWNRTDCCSERLTNYRIWTKSATGDWEEFSPGLKTYDPNQTYPLTFNGNKQARYVMIQLTGKGVFLSLAEVKVFGSN
ncbi:MAG TPA: discoidin domain-containing protein [Pyrinomonadaceae bacterium]|nr:discoidin domain-containing protein [Pyrinomonadaceae bacterium]